MAICDCPSKLTRATLLNLRAGGKSRFGLDRVGEVALAAAGAVLGRQETDKHVARRQARVRVDRLEAGIYLARVGDQAKFDVHVKRLAVVGHRDRGLIVLGVGRDRDDIVAKADRSELEGFPVQVRVKLIGDHDLLSGGGRRGIVLEIDLVGQRAGRVDEPLRAVAGGTELGVGVH